MMQDRQREIFCDCDNIAGVTYWEHQYRQNIAEANAVGRGF